MIFRLSGRARGGGSRGGSPLRRWCFVAFVAALFAAFAFAGAALAGLQTYYSDSLGPNGYASTPGWNNRDYNRACRNGNSGQMSVAYYNTDNIRVAWSGVVWTNCGTGAVARLENNGYYKCRCTNEGTVTFPVICQTWNL